MSNRAAWLVAVLAGCLFLAYGCSDDDGGQDNNNINNNNNNNNNNNTNTNTNDDTIYQLQDEGNASFIPEDGEVELNGVIVTAVDTYGTYQGNIWVQEPQSGQFSGVLLYNPTISNGSIADLSPGYIVNVTGIKDEFALSDPPDTTGRTMTEVTSANVELVAPGQPLDPVDVSSPTDIMVDPGGEQYEGVLVRVRNVRAIETNQYGDKVFTGGLVVTDDLMDVFADVVDASCYAEIIGVTNYFFQYMLIPRSSADIVLATNDGDCPVIPIEDDCDDGIDNDNNGFTDCQDYACQGTGACAENTPALCSDGEDNDLDSYTDCDDVSCRNHPDVLIAGTCGEETGDATCVGGVDDDGDQYTDCDDWSCQLNPDVTVCGPITEREDTSDECSDGIDNDSNNFTDCDDNSCIYAGFCTTVEESTEADCTDGQDNDGDQFTDCEDWSCQHSILVFSCEGNIYTCSDDIDNDGNGFVDCNDFACRNCTYNYSSPVCPPCP